MPWVLMQFEVKDFDVWYDVFESNTDLRAEYGAMETLIFQGDENPNRVTLVVEWDDLDNAREFFASAELRERMQQAGVIPPPQVTYMHEM